MKQSKAKKRTLICFAVPFESAGLRRKLRQFPEQERIFIFHGGMGARAFVPNLFSAVQKLAPQRIILGGFCAGLHPLAAPASRFVSTPEEIQNFFRQATDRALKNEPLDSMALTGRLYCQHRLDPKIGHLISVSQVLETAAQKAAISANDASLLVADMETIPALCAISKFPSEVWVVRVVSDGPGENLPLPAKVLFSEKTNSVPIACLAVHLLTRPQKLSRFVQFVRQSFIARGKLTTAVCSLLAR